MKKKLKQIKDGIKSIWRNIFGLEDQLQNTNNSGVDNSELEAIKTRLSDLGQKFKQLATLPQTVADLQAQIKNLSAGTGNPKLPQLTGQKPQQITQQQTVSSPAKPSAPTAETHYVKRMSASGDIETRSQISKSEALFELTTLGNTAELRPLTEQSAYLIMQQRYLLEPAFNVSGKGQRINCTATAKYELQGNVWGVKMKGKIELV